MKTLKLIIAGGRDFNRYLLLKKKTSEFISALLGAGNSYYPGNTLVEIVCGLAKGADTLGERFGKHEGYNITYFPAEWSKYGKSAGYRRNEEMAIYADACICFWDGESRGTKHMIDLAKQYNLALKIINYIKPEPICPLKTYVPLRPSQ